MRAFFIECYFFRFKHKKIRLWCFLHSTGDETLKKSFASGFLFDENCRIRGPPSFNLKKFKLKGDKNGFFT